MLEKLTLLFPSDFFDKNVVDNDLKNEYDAALGTGLFDVILFSYDDWFNKEVVILDKKPKEVTRVIYRGWMMTPKKYRCFEHALWCENIELITGCVLYDQMHAFPNIYNQVYQDTVRMVTFPDGEKVDIELIKQCFDRFMIKDYVKSVKGSQFPKYFSSDITQQELDNYLVQFRKFRGDLFTGGICIKEYVDLKKYGKQTNEYRVFYARGEVISICRNSLQQSFTQEPPAELIKKYQHLDSPFYTIDFAEKEDGSWIIIETGDGQVSGLSVGQNQEAFYRSLYHAMTKALDWRWSLVGNIVETREYGEEKEIKQGTKHFSGGAKVYLAPIQWGDGYENVIMIGRPRYKKGFIEIVQRSRHVTNFRLQKVYSPALLNLMAKSKYRWWGNTDNDRDKIEQLAGFLNKKND